MANNTTNSKLQKKALVTAGQCNLKQSVSMGHSGVTIESFYEFDMNAQGSGRLYFIINEILLGPDIATFFPPSYPATFQKRLRK